MPDTPPPDPGTPATLAHLLAVQGMLRVILATQIRTGQISPLAFLSTSPRA